MKTYEGIPVPFFNFGCQVLIRKDMKDLCPHVVSFLNDNSIQRKGSQHPGYVVWYFTEAMYLRATDFLHSVGYIPAIRP